MKTTISPEEVRHIARLARLRFSDEELAGFTDRFNQILAYVEKLTEVDVEGVEPMTGMHEETDTMRDDVEGPMLPQSAALRNAPGKTEGFFTVPKVIGDVPG